MPSEITKICQVEVPPGTEASCLHTPQRIERIASCQFPLWATIREVIFDHPLAKTLMGDTGWIKVPSSSLLDDFVRGGGCNSIDHRAGAAGLLDPMRQVFIQQLCKINTI